MPAGRLVACCEFRGGLMDHSIVTSLVVFFVFMVISVVCFLIFREVVAWYWKINEALALLTKIEANTRKL